MKNDFCDLPQAEIFALDVPIDLKGLLLSPFQFNQQHGSVIVPTETFKEMIDVITEYSLIKHKEAQALKG
ncbi:hypothetical protein RYA05_03360 [Pseudomonas syringae pv. actinidiae]|nr:hypothetical protein [Pseudomonas syringae pv. actinidiae]